jgi:hypothetical protein
MPGGDLLFQRLSVSTIGAVWFHGRVRDGIGWVTDAMATKQWDQWMRVFKSMHTHPPMFRAYERLRAYLAGVFSTNAACDADLTLIVQTLKRDMNY